MKIGVLTSSRADYGIYYPLLSRLKIDDFFDLEIIAFGGHLSQIHGYTITEIEKESFKKVHKISSLISNDDPQSISTSYALTSLKFSSFWNENIYDLVFCLGDRFEMNAAVQAGIPFGIKFAHFHGGEVTLGAIDNIYRDQITLASEIHFTALENSKEKIIGVKGDDKNIFVVGSLSLSNIESFRPIKKKIFYEEFDLPNEDFILMTFHTETQNHKNILSLTEELKKVIMDLSKNYFLVITMPNADTNNSHLRSTYNKLYKKLPNRIKLVENFGLKYFSVMYYSKFLIGNSSSGIIEAASFGKYVLNVGERQKGRSQSKNIINCDFLHNDILKSVSKLKSYEFKGKNIYQKNAVVENIIKKLKNGKIY